MKKLLVIVAMLGCIGWLSGCDDTTNNIINQGTPNPVFAANDIQDKRFAIKPKVDSGTPTEYGGDVTVIDFANDNSAAVLEVENKLLTRSNGSWEVTPEGTLIVTLDDGSFQEYIRESISSRRILVESEKGKQQLIALSAMTEKRVAGKHFSFITANNVFLAVKIDDTSQAFHLFSDDVPAGVWSIVDGYLRLTFDDVEVTGSEQIDIALLEGSFSDGEVVVIDRKADLEPTNMRNSKVEQAKQYGGTRLSLNFQDIELRSVLQLLADSNGSQVVLDPAINRSITLRLRDVPFEAALDILLQSQDLEMATNNDVMVVAEQGKIEPNYSSKIYKGGKLTLNFQDIEVRSLLQSLSDFQSKSIAVDDDVNGTMTLRLTDVLADQVLDIVLMLNDLQVYDNGYAVLVSKES